VFAHARGLYEGCRLCKHYVGKLKCLGSGTLMIFDPRPKEHQHFKLPDSLLEKKIDPTEASHRVCYDVGYRVDVASGASPPGQIAMTR
jgi:hypothetical protein